MENPRDPIQKLPGFPGRQEEFQDQHLAWHIRRINHNKPQPFPWSEQAEEEENFLNTIKIWVFYQKLP